MSRSASGQRLPKVLWPLMFGNVVIGMGVMMVPGLINEIHHALNVPVTTAGQLISTAALIVSIGAPVLATVLGRRDRRLLLAGSLLWYAVFHALAAVSPDFDSLLFSRILAMVSAAVFTPQAAACIGLLVDLAALSSGMEEPEATAMAVISEIVACFSHQRVYGYIFVALVDPTEVV